MVRLVKIFLIALVALWGLIGAAGNFAHLDAAYKAVESVTLMPTFPADAAPPWRTDNPVVVWLGVALIVVGKIAAGAFCAYGAVLMVKARRADSAAFQLAKRFALVGCAFAVAMLFGGFTVIGETLYAMFRYPEHVQAAAGAFRYGGFIALIMIFVGQTDGND